MRSRKSYIIRIGSIYTDAIREHIPTTVAIFPFSFPIQSFVFKRSSKEKLFLLHSLHLLEVHNRKGTCIYIFLFVGIASFCEKHCYYDPHCLSLTFVKKKQTFVSFCISTWVTLNITLTKNRLSWSVFSKTSNVYLNIL